MPVITFLRASGEARRVSADAGDTVMRTGVGAGIDGIEAICGGACSCGTCHVYVAEAWLALLPPPREDELALLEFVDAPRTAASRLSCQLHVSEELDGLVVTVPG